MKRNILTGMAVTCALLFPVISQAETKTTKVYVSEVDDVQYGSVAGYILVDFKGRKVLEKPDEFSVYNDNKSMLIAAYTGYPFSTHFLVEGDIRYGDYDLIPVHHNYRYGETFRLMTNEGKLRDYIRYKIINLCDPDDTYTGMTGANGLTVRFTTEKPCDVQLLTGDDIK
ncbi:hypothetical protein [Morganella morganii]|uniref:hypothetical protein n=1 Tax=Morganella morganii TaxID=582 RepID=UPI000FC18BB7|nr:hypothetical protein [Morganella morganii]MIQ93976.1 hypothetical protein [Salmonella enterica subsp. enterica serovar Enteritidis]MBT0420662.1 hypothetical protein [Morganella morganii subsp. morganii]MBT0515304.1 hypothetical protein [Morganella morganii subsp. morganii]MCU6354617.1 hypothetical protein [Morganella morganii]MRE59354.1 hypothetical protein [Morganella morganii]